MDSATAVFLNGPPFLPPDLLTFNPYLLVPVIFFYHSAKNPIQDRNLNISTSEGMVPGTRNTPRKTTILWSTSAGNYNFMPKNRNIWISGKTLLKYLLMPLTFHALFVSVPDLKLFISDPEPQNENQEFLIRILM